MGTLFKAALSFVGGKWRELAVAGLVIWVVHGLSATNEKLGELTVETARSRDAVNELKAGMDQLKDLHGQMLNIQKEQLALTKKLSDDYEQQRRANEADTNNKVDAITNGALRLSIKRQPASDPTKHPVPYPASR